MKAKASSLIAEAEMDDAGELRIHPGDKQRYEGGAFEIDVYCGTVANRQQCSCGSAHRACHSESGRIWHAAV